MVRYNSKCLLTEIKVNIIHRECLKTVRHCISPQIILSVPIPSTWFAHMIPVHGK